METQLVAAGSKGSVSFIAAHSVGLVMGGGILLGLGAYYYFKKKEPIAATQEEPQAEAEAA